MAFLKVGGKPKYEWYPVLVSTTCQNGQPMIFNGSGYLEPIQSASSINIFGIAGKTIYSTDSDFATPRKIPVTPVDEDALFLADVLTGTATAAMVGNRYNFDATLMGIDVTNTADGQFLITSYVSPTQVYGKFTSDAFQQHAS